MFARIYHSRQASLANHIAYGLVPEQIAAEKYN